MSRDKTVEGDNYLVSCFLGSVEYGNMVGPRREVGYDSLPRGRYSLLA